MQIDERIVDGVTILDLKGKMTLGEGDELLKDKINSFTPPPPGTPGDPNAYKAGGILDFDSNANCNGDGKQYANSNCYRCLSYCHCYFYGHGYRDSHTNGNAYALADPNPTAYT